jgi:hypothetical protein
VGEPPLPERKAAEVAIEATVLRQVLRDAPEGECVYFAKEAGDAVLDRLAELKPALSASDCLRWSPEGWIRARSTVLVFVREIRWLAETRVNLQLWRCHGETSPCAVTGYDLERDQGGWIVTSTRGIGPQP